MRAHVFPGVGRQKKGMGAALFPEFPDLCRRADDILGYSIEELCLHNPQRRLAESEYSQPATFVVNALHHAAALRRGGPPADYLAGHSLGEYNALLAAGVVDLDTGLRMVQRRGVVMGQVSGGGMGAVVGTSEAVIDELLRTEEATGVVVANYNAPDQFVLAGSAEALERIRPLVIARHGEDSFVPLKVGGIASHSPRMAEVAASFRDFLDGVELAAPHTPVLSNVTGRPYEPDPESMRTALAEQIARPVRWVDCVRFLRGAGVTEFVELGENDTLTKFIARITAAEPATPETDHARRDLIARLKRDVLVPEVGDAATELGDDDSFRQLGVDSIVYVRVARRVASVFGVPTKPDLIYRNRTYGALADHLLGLVPEASPGDTGPWRDHRDERVIDLLRDCVDGAIGLDDLIERVHAGLPDA